MRTIAIITARGGSKRIPHKNIKEFCGKPILAYSIEAALGSGVFDVVMVSTDSEEIREIAQRYGASVPFLRSEATSTDFATTNDVLKEVIHTYQNLGEQFERMACIYPTAPFVTGDELKDAMQRLDQSDADSLMSVVRFSFPPQRALIIREGKVQYQYPVYKAARSQDLEPIYHDCGQFYICETKQFLKYGSMITDRTMPYILPEEKVQDIDTMSDWVIAEAKYTTLMQNEDSVNEK